MNIEEIRNKWTNKCKDKKAAVDLWDSMAGQFKQYEIPGDESLLLKIIDREKMIQPAGSVLDVGCGTGRYSAALADKAAEITGIDLSPKMIEFGKENIKTLGIKNVNLICCDWSELDIAESGFENRFDLVFAHMTPAVSDAVTFEKMIRCSKKHGIMFKPTRRTDEISDEVMKLAGVNQKNTGRDESILYAFDMLWLMGYKPKLQYEEQEWNIRKTFEEACGMYVNRVKTYKRISMEEEEKIKQFLQTKLRDSIIEEKVKTTITALIWSKS